MVGLQVSGEGIDALGMGDGGKLLGTRTHGGVGERLRLRAEPVMRVAPQRRVGTPRLVVVACLNRDARHRPARVIAALAQAGAVVRGWQPVDSRQEPLKLCTRRGGHEMVLVSITRSCGMRYVHE